MQKKKQLIDKETITYPNALRKFPKVITQTMDKSTITNAIKVEKSGDNLPILNRPSIDKETLTKAVTVNGPFVAIDNPSISKGSLNLKPYRHPNYKNHHTNQKSMHILKQWNTNSTHF
jgi:hypothetical protein